MIQIDRINPVCFATDTIIEDYLRSLEIMMKKIVSSVALILMLTALGAWADQLIVPGERIGQVKLGMKHSDLSGLLGEPDMKPGEPVDGIIEYNYIKKHLLIVDVDVKTRRVTAVATGLIAHYKTAGGIGIGSGVTEIKKGMGRTEPVKIANNALMLKYPEKGIEFTFNVRDGYRKVFLIVVRQVEKAGK